MKKIFGIVFMVLLGTALFAQDANKVVGVWLTQDGDSKVEIKKDASGKYNGTIIWLKEPLKDGKPKVDDKNPDKKMHTRKIEGLRILEGFEFDSKKNEWINGTIYDPKEGKTYKCFMWFKEDPNKLSVKGFIGFSFIGREVVWTRDK
jgi:uncharacterized protein (DUF2147 family)